jgi:DNA-binding CsgD family transcriptional regulator
MTKLPRPLTAREKEILAIVLQGKRNREIGCELNVKPRTVGKHLESIYAKLEVKTRAAAVHKFYESVIADLKAEIEELRALVIKLRRQLAPRR